MNKIIGELLCLLENGISNNNERELLAQSLFYYCCGKDPTPIVHFGSDYPLYIYSDALLSGQKFENEIEMLYWRLQNHGYILVETENFTKWKNVENVALSLWATSNNRLFSLIYVHNDAEETFRKIYSDKNNYIQPKCICNYRYEGVFPFMEKIEKRTEYIFGYCFENKYKSIAKYSYYGDYEKNTKVTLYRRCFWYFW